MSDEKYPQSKRRITDLCPDLACDQNTGALTAQEAAFIAHVKERLTEANAIHNFWFRPTMPDDLYTLSEVEYWNLLAHRELCVWEPLRHTRPEMRTLSL